MCRKPPADAQLELRPSEDELGITTVHGDSPWVVGKIRRGSGVQDGKVGVGPGERGGSRRLGKESSRGLCPQEQLGQKTGKRGFGIAREFVCEKV